MKASQILIWHKNISPGEFPDGVLDNMDAYLLNDCIFPLRTLSQVPMTPSPLVEAHIRNEGTSQHSIEGGRLSTATDMQVSSISRMVTLMYCAERIRAIGGIGIYFDTNKPLVHIDSRKERLVWLAYKKDGKRVYLYRENDPVKFYKKLGELLDVGQN